MEKARVDESRKAHEGDHESHTVKGKVAVLMRATEARGWQRESAILLSVAG